MITKLTMLVFCGLLSLALALATITIHFVRFGGKTIRSNREQYPPLDGIAGRVVWAHGNLTESLIPFAIVVLVANAGQVSNGWTIYGSEPTFRRCGWEFFISCENWKQKSFSV